MAHGAKGQAGPARARPNHHHQATRLDRELLELERRKLVELSSGRIALTRDGYAAILKLARGGRS